MALKPAEHEQRGYRSGGPGLRLILLVAFSIALMVLDQRGQHLDQARRTLSDAFYPLLYLVDAPFTLVDTLRENLALRSELLARNRELDETLLLTNARLQRMAALEAENARLRALLDSTENLPGRVLIAEILSIDMDPLRHRIVLNRGLRDGVHAGQALIDAEGIVGQVTREHGRTAEALLITDPDHGVPVEVVRNGLRTVAMGTGDLERLSLPFLPRNADIRAGDLLVTSGLGGSFPAGYPVGTVRRVDDSAGAAFSEVDAEPAARLNRIREVLLVFPDEVERGHSIQDSPPDPSAGDAPAPADDAPETGNGEAET